MFSNITNVSSSFLFYMFSTNITQHQHYFYIILNYSKHIKLVYSLQIASGHCVMKLLGKALQSESRREIIFLIQLKFLLLTKENRVNFQNFWKIKNAPLNILQAAIRTGMLLIILSLFSLSKFSLLQYRLN